MCAPAILAASLLLGAADVACEALPPGEAGAWAASARGLELWSRGELEAARACLQAAARGLPDSEVVVRDLATVEAQLGLASARGRYRRARELGDPGGGFERALLEARLRGVAGLAGDEIELLIARTAHGSPEDALVLGAYVERLPLELRPTARLALAANAIVSGVPAVAADIAGQARSEAELAGDPYVANAAGELARRAEAAARLQAELALQIYGEHVYRPGFVAGQPSAPATSGRVRASLQTPLGPATIRVGVEARQRIFLADREALSGVERGGLHGHGEVELPISADLRSAVIRVRLDGLTVRAEDLSRAIATGVEGGVALRIALGARWWGSIGLYGLWTNFAEAPRADDRDRTGQRARLSVSYESPVWSAGGELGILHDESISQAFDMLGLGVGLFGVVRLWSPLELRGRVSLLGRRFGPVGDEAVIGEAPRQREARVQTRLGLAWRISPVFAVLANSRLVWSDGDGHPDYRHHTGQLGLEARW